MELPLPRVRRKLFFHSQFVRRTRLCRYTAFSLSTGNPMKLTHKQRTAVSTLATPVLVFIIGWAVYCAWMALDEVDKLDTEFNELSAKFRFQVGLDARRLKDMQKQYSDIADHLKKVLNDSNASLINYAIGNDQQELTNFWAKSLGLKMWLREQEPLVNQGKLLLKTSSVPFKANVKQSVMDIDRAYDVYLASARE